MILAHGDFLVSAEPGGGVHQPVMVAPTPEVAIRMASRRRISAEAVTATSRTSGGCNRDSMARISVADPATTSPTGVVSIVVIRSPDLPPLTLEHPFESKGYFGQINEPNVGLQSIMAGSVVSSMLSHGW